MIKRAYLKFCCHFLVMMSMKSVQINLSHTSLLTDVKALF